MKTTRFPAFLVLLLTIAAAQSGSAQEVDLGTTHPDVSLTANVAVTSDYRFRGITQTSRQIAVQGGFDIAPVGNWYAGLWASSIETASATETDVYAGVGGPLGENFEYDFRYTWYHYPEDKDYWEFSASISKSGYLMGGKDKTKTINTNLTLGLVGTTNYYGGTGGFLYPSIDFSFDLTSYVVMNLHFGYNAFTKDNPGFFADSTNSYVDWSIGVTTEAINNAFWTLAVVGTDVDTATCWDQRNWCKEKLVLTMTKEF